MALADQCELMAGYIALEYALISNAIATFSYHCTSVASSTHQAVHVERFKVAALCGKNQQI